MKPYLLIALALSVAALSSSAPDKPSDAITGQQAQQILEELRQVHALLDKLLSAAPAPATAPAAPRPELPRASFKIDSTAQHIGKNDAPLTVVEFVDYECSYCRQFHQTTFRDIRKNYVDTGRVRFYTIDFPLDMHSNARKASVAAYCAAEQGQFWSMREALIGNGNRLAGEGIADIARSLYLDMPPFQNCLASTKYDAVIQKHVDAATALGVSGTPTFVVGRTTREGVEGALLVGASPYASFDDELKKLDPSK